jgi:hypothetical protein
MGSYCYPLQIFERKKFNDFCHCIFHLTFWLLLIFSIQEMQEKMPSDPFEAELLMMAEAVAHGGRGDDSESDASEDEAYCK